MFSCCCICISYRFCYLFGKIKFLFLFLHKSRASEPMVGQYRGVVNNELGNQSATCSATAGETPCILSIVWNALYADPSHSEPCIASFPAGRLSTFPVCHSRYPPQHTENTFQHKSLPTICTKPARCRSWPVMCNPNT